MGINSWLIIIHLWKFHLETLSLNIHINFKYILLSNGVIYFEVLMELRSIFTFVKMIQDRSMKTLHHFYTFNHKRQNNVCFPACGRNYPAADLLWNWSPLKLNDTLCYSPWKIMNDKEKSVFIRALSQLRWPYWVLFSENCTNRDAFCHDRLINKTIPQQYWTARGWKPDYILITENK